MSRMTLEQINEKLEAATAAGAIYNVEMTDIKFKLGNLLWRDEALQAARRNVEKLFVPLRDELKVYEALCNINASNAHDLLNAVNAINRGTAKAKNADAAAIVAFFSVAKDYIRAAEMIKGLKDKVVKGRKPAENPIHVRTIENTGTCGCCGRNIKLTSASRIVDHGYGIHNRGYGFGTGYKAGGSCFGYGYEPIEVSPKVWHAMLESWQQRLAKLPQALETANQVLAEKAPFIRTSPEHPVLTEAEKRQNRERSIAQDVVRDLTREMTTLPEHIEDITERIAGWKAKPLPGESSRPSRGSK